MSLTIFTKSPIFDVWQGSEMWKCEMLLILPLKNCESRKKQTTALSMIICLGLPLISFFVSFMETNDLRRPEEKKTSGSIFMDTLQLCQACRFSTMRQFLPPSPKEFPVQRALWWGQFSLMCIWIFSFALEKYLPTILLMIVFYHHLPSLLNVVGNTNNWIQKCH